MVVTIIIIIILLVLLLLLLLILLIKTQPAHLLSNTVFYFVTGSKKLKDHRCCLSVLGPGHSAIRSAPSEP